MLKKTRRKRRGRRSNRPAALFVLAALGLFIAGQNGAALDTLARTGIDLRDVVSGGPAPRDYQPIPTNERRAEPVDTQNPSDYDRSVYGGWIDESGNCHNTRAEVLLATSTGPVHMRKNGCSVDRGKWFDPFTGRTFTEASDVDIDHLVPLAWAHARGGAEWPAERKRAFANWQVNLLPVQSSVNREKGASGPDKWLPPRVEYRCEYLLRFERVMKTWGLTYFPDEAQAATELKAHYCPVR